MRCQCLTCTPLFIDRLLVKAADITKTDYSGHGKLLSYVFRSGSFLFVKFNVIDGRGR